MSKLLSVIVMVSSIPNYPCRVYKKNQILLETWKVGTIKSSMIVNSCEGRYDIENQYGYQ
ncbi:hypothetical protein Anas_13699 [Armadillidium nasatum]|uniref:Uncharacterized protein n=1 Tax=Armadillidium nasatum TaxID=96803 RepID=A0A5N5T8T8_9CRUS|nr:hypothetical protein Anas_13699 [Armadillidium nasatum]